MSRIQVKVIATATSLRLAATDGTATLEVTPDSVFSVGNSIGGYIAAPIDAAKPHVWGIWRLTGGQCDRLRDHAPSGELPKGVTLNGSRYLNPAVGRNMELLARIKRMEPEAVVVSGREYLFATSSGSARNGILHRYAPPADPVKRALYDGGVDKNRWREETLANGADMYVGYRATYYLSEWVITVCDDQTQQVTAGYASNYGYLLAATDATFAVSWRDVAPQNAFCYQEVVIYTTPGADRNHVADAVRRLLALGRDGLRSAIRAVQEHESFGEWVRFNEMIVG